MRQPVIHSVHGHSGTAIALRTLVEAGGTLNRRDINARLLKHHRSKLGVRDTMIVLEKSGYILLNLVTITPAGIKALHEMESRETKCLIPSS